MLSDLGRGVLDSHQIGSTASFTRTLSTFTHCAGLGIFAGFNQKNSCARWNRGLRRLLGGSHKSKSSLYGYNERVGWPLIQVLPRLITKEPVFFSTLWNCRANGLNYRT